MVKHMDGGSRTEFADTPGSSRSGIQRGFATLSGLDGSDVQRGSRGLGATAQMLWPLRAGERGRVRARRLRGSEVRCRRDRVGVANARAPAQAEVRRG
jgi:hypothetical protein